MRHAIGRRREMAIRTIFNLLGPLTNPAGAPNQLMGVFDDQWVEPLAQVLARLGSDHVLVVHSADGLDEISIAAPTRVAELRAGEVSEYTIDPADYGVAPAPAETLAVNSPAESLAMMHAVLDGRSGPAADVVALNAGAAIYAAGLRPDLATGIDCARETLAGGGARERLDALVALSGQLSSGPASA